MVQVAGGGADGGEVEALDVDGPLEDGDEVAVGDQLGEVVLERHRLDHLAQGRAVGAVGGGGDEEDLDGGVGGGEVIDDVAVGVGGAVVALVDPDEPELGGVELLLAAGQRLDAGDDDLRFPVKARLVRSLLRLLDRRHVPGDGRELLGRLADQLVAVRDAEDSLALGEELTGGVGGDDRLAAAGGQDAERADVAGLEPAEDGGDGEILVAAELEVGELHAAAPLVFIASLRSDGAEPYACSSIQPRPSQPMPARQPLPRQ